MKKLSTVKNISVLSILGLFIAFGNISCTVRSIIDSIPVPDILKEEKLPHKVAILPFVNKTSTPEGGEMVRKMFYNFFSSLNYIDLELAIIDESLKRTDLYQQIAAGKPVSPQKIGQLLGVDAVIIGEVTSLGKIYAIIYSDNKAGLKARMISCQNAEVIWELEHKIHIEEGDVPLSPISLATTMVRTAVEHSQASHVKAAAELCMQAVSTIPNPPSVSDPPPKIHALVHNGAGKLLRPGDYLRVAIVGEEGQKASWSLPPLVENFPMKEKKPGIYVGAYRIKQRDRLPHGRITGYLSAETGTGSQWVDALGSLKIGEPTQLPPVIAKDTVLEWNKSPYLVNDALVVLPGITLTLRPGTVVWFRSLGLIVKGKIQILGTEEKPVRLAGLGSSNWKGLIFDRSSAENVISYCEILDAEFGIRASGSNITVQHSLFQDNIWGIMIDNGSIKVNSSLIRTSKKTAIAARKSRLEVKDSFITENKAGGFLLENSQVQIEQNNIVNNGGWGIKVLSNPAPVQAPNNWWGKIDPDKTEIIGSVNISPVLKEPIDFMILD